MSRTGVAPSRGTVELAIERAFPQRRLTVLARLALAVPHYVALACAGVVALVVLVFGWFGALMTGALPSVSGDFLSGLAGWYTRVGAYSLLLTDRYPPFGFDGGSYPVQVLISPSGRLRRSAVLFRFALVIPAQVVLTATLLGSAALGVVAWAVVLIAGRLPQPLQQAFGTVLRFELRYQAYSTLLTSSYPWWGVFGDPAHPASEADGVGAPMPSLPPRPGALPRGGAAGGWHVAGVTGGALASIVWPPAAGAEVSYPAVEDKRPVVTEAAPTPGEVAPSLGEVAPILGDVAPVLGEVGPAVANVVSTAGEVSFEGSPSSVCQDPRVVSPDVFTYGGDTYLWGYSADRQVCGIWRRSGPRGAGQTWPIVQQEAAWARFRSIEPKAMPYEAPLPATIGLDSDSAPSLPPEAGSYTGTERTGMERTGMERIDAGRTGMERIDAGRGVELSFAGSPNADPDPDPDGTSSATPDAKPAATPEFDLLAPGSDSPPEPAPSGGTAAWPEMPTADPTSPWAMVLSQTARRLVVLMVAVGAVTLLAGYVGGQLATGPPTLSTDPVPLQLSQAYSALHTRFAEYEAESDSCPTSAHPLPCVTTAARVVAAGFGSFSSQVRGMSIPAAARSTRRQLYAVSDELQRAFGVLAASSSVARYEQGITTSGLPGLLDQFDARYQRLQDLLVPSSR